jgi:anti-anti-sigma factor
MKLTTSYFGDRAVIAIEGDFEFHGVKEFRDASDAVFLHPNLARVEIDLGRATYIDSSALGILLVTRESAKKKGTALALTHVTGRVRTVLEMARFNKLFEMNS